MDVDVPVSPSEIHEDFDTWLTDRKKRWRDARLAKKRSRDSAAKSALGDRRANQGQLMGDILTAQLRGGREASGLASYMQDRQALLHKNHWQIVEIRPAQTPGEFVLWVYTDVKKLQRVNVFVPRKIYIHNYDSAGPDQVVGKLVKHHLPRYALTLIHKLCMYRRT